MVEQPTLDKIRKLFAVANDKGATEDEASTAMRLAMGIMARHGISREAIGDGLDKTPKATTRRAEQTLKKYEVNIYQAAGVLYGCKILTYAAGKQGIEFIGRVTNIEAAELTAGWLMQQLERLYKEALPRGLSQPERAVFRRTFKYACSVRVITRAVELMERMKKDDREAMEISGSKALVVVNHFQLLDRENQAVMAEMKVRRVKARQTKWGSGTTAGLMAGDRVQLRKEVK